MSDEELNCTFCGKSNEDKSCLCLIASPNNTYICNECVETARDIVGVYRSGNNKIVYMGNDKPINNDKGDV